MVVATKCKITPPPPHPPAAAYEPILVGYRVLLHNETKAENNSPGGESRTSQRFGNWQLLLGY